MADNYFPDQNDDFKANQARIERQRKLAQDLVARGIAANGGQGYQGGPVYMVGNQWGNLAQGLGGAVMQGMADNEEQKLIADRNAQQSDWQRRFNAAPINGEQAGPVQEGEAPLPRIPSKQELLYEARNKGLRTDLEREFLKREDEQQARAEQATQNALDRAAQAKERRDWQEQQDKLYKRTFEQQKDLKQTPTIHITNAGTPGQGKPPSGYRWTADGNLEPIPGGPGDKTGKPLNPKQLETQRGFMDMESSLGNYEQLLNAYDFQGKSAIDPAKRAALEAAYTDVQMKLKTLYELGAPQAGDLRLLAQAIPNPTDLSGTLRGAAFGSAPFTAKLGETRRLLQSSKANFEKQFDKPTPPADPPPKAGTGRTLVRSPAEFAALPAGTKWETPDGRKGTK